MNVKGTDFWEAATLSAQCSPAGGRHTRHDGKTCPRLAGCTQQAVQEELSHSVSRLSHPLLRMFTSPVGNTNASRAQKSCSMKNLESMPPFWNMAGNEGDPVWCVYFIKPLERKAILDCFIEVNLVVGFFCVFCFWLFFLLDWIYGFWPEISITRDFSLWDSLTHISVGSFPDGGGGLILAVPLQKHVCNCAPSLCPSGELGYLGYLQRLAAICLSCPCCSLKSSGKLQNWKQLR